jgi:hypothetical protein
MLPMARRGKNSIKPLWIVIGAVLLIAAFFGSRLFLNATSEPFRTTPELEVKAYLENANSLRSNVYKLKGEVVNSLAWSPTMGRLFSVSVGDGADVVPVLVTPKFNQMNIQKGQKYIFLLKVDDSGMLRTENLTKT